VKRNYGLIALNGDIVGGGVLFIAFVVILWFCWVFASSLSKKPEPTDQVCTFKDSDAHVSVLNCSCIKHQYVLHPDYEYLGNTLSHCSKLGNNWDTLKLRHPTCLYKFHEFLHESDNNPTYRVAYRSMCDVMSEPNETN
jgi:hypothetical protein